MDKETPQLPFYVVVQDKSQVNLHPTEIKEFISINYDEIINKAFQQRSANHTLVDNTYSCNELFERPINLYPEVYYKFEDEEPAPITSNNNNKNKDKTNLYKDNDIVIVIDIDSQLNIVDSKCLNHNYQIFKIAKFKNSDIVNMSGNSFNRFEDRTNIIIQITSNELEFVDSKLHRSNHNYTHNFHKDKNQVSNTTLLIPENLHTNPTSIDDDINDIKKIVEIFNKRNSQLESFIKLNSKIK